MTREYLYIDKTLNIILLFITITTEKKFLLRYIEIKAWKIMDYS